MKKLIAIAAVVIVSFSAQSSICGQGACKVTFVDVDVDGTEKPIMLLDDAMSSQQSSMGRLFNDENNHGPKIQTELKSSVTPAQSEKSSPVQPNRDLKPVKIYSV